MTFGETVNPIVKQQDGHVQIAPQQVKQVVSADAEAITIAGDDPDREVGIGDFHAGGDSGGAAVDGVKPVGVHVIGESARAADARNDHEVFTRNAEFRQRALERVEDGVIAATGAPADIVRSDKVLASEPRNFGDVLNFSGHGLLGVEELQDAFADFADFEWATLDFGHGNGIHEEFGADEE